MVQICNDIIYFLLLGILPAYLVKLIDLALAGETMGYLLGTLVGICVVTAAFHVPEQYRGFTLIWIIISMSVSYWAIRHPFR